MWPANILAVNRNDTVHDWITFLTVSIVTVKFIKGSGVLIDKNISNNFIRTVVKSNRN